jgi:general secretion pathway protein K
VHKQRGMVLILAMLIVVLVISITVGLSWRYNLSLTRSENRWHGLQARAYLEGAETLAMVVLQEDARLDQENGRLVDSLDEFWAQPSDPFPTAEGWVQGRLEDAQGRFNLNLLQQKPAAMSQNPSSNLPLSQRFTASQKRFIRLLQTFEFEDGPIDQARAVEITEAVIDWIDVDQAVSGFGGAETPYYQQLDPPTTPPNLPMVSVSELIHIKGMTAELYRALLPYVIALPESANLNVNTMPLALMRTLAGANDFSPLLEADAQLLMDERSGMGGDTEAPTNGNQMAPPTGGFESVQALESSPVLTALLSAAGGLDTDGLVVDSHYFLLFSEARVGDKVSDGASMLKQENAKVTVIRRTDAHF